jgi:hypothetical protein
MQKERPMTDFLAANWLWIVLVVAMFAMHRGGHGSHGRHDNEREADRQGADLEGADPLGNHSAHR